MMDYKVRGRIRATKKDIEVETKATSLAEAETRVEQRSPNIEVIKTIEQPQAEQPAEETK